MTRKIRNAVTLVVDGREVVAPEGTMLVDAAKGGDIEIPVFCYEPKLGQPVGACRMCLVEVEGMPKLQTACSTPVRDGMVVYTQTDQVKEAQNAVVEFLLVNHPLDCPVCDKGGECPLQDISMGWGPGRSRFTEPKRHFEKPIELSPLIAIDRERCILCYRCVRFSQEVSEDEQLQLLERGDRSFVGTFDDRPYVAPFHGNITELCPVGALTNYTYRFRARPWDVEDAGSICTLCPSQCNIKLTVRDERVARVLARDNAEVDDGWLCDKGRYGFQMLDSEDRITAPMVRGGDGSLQPVSWDAALEKVAAGLKAAGEKTAALVEGGASNEEGWLLRKILGEAPGSARVSSSPVATDPATLRDLGRPELTAKTSEIDIAGAILVVGCDPLNEMPILDLRIRKAVRREGARLAVASERPTALDGGAGDVVRYAPGEAGAFLSSLAAALGAAGFEAGGADAEQAQALAEALRGVPDPVIVWGEGVGRSPGAVEALLACARALEMDKRLGPGLLEIPLAANGRGLREVGCLGDAGAIRAGLEREELDAVVLFDSDPVRTHHDSEGWKRALRAADFVVAVSMFDDASTRLADVVLPLEGYGEKDGTVTHPDGRVQRLRRTVDVPDGVRLGWRWLLELSARLGHDLGIDSEPELLEALTEDVAIYAGLTHAELGGQGVRWQERSSASNLAASSSPGSGAGPEGHWPPKTASEPATANRVGPAGSAPGSADNADGLRLGTYRDIWASEVTERNPALRFLKPAQRIELSPADAKKLGVEHGQPVTVSGDGESVEARAAIRSSIEPGVAFMIEGTAEANANALANGRPQMVEVKPA